MKYLFFIFCILIQINHSYGQCKLDYSNYDLVFSDDFDTYPSVDDLEPKWRFNYPWGDGDGSTCGNSLLNHCGEDEYYMKSQVSLLPGGILRLTATKLSSYLTM